MRSLLFETPNLTFPDSTYDDLVFHNVASEELPSTAGDGFIEATLPAARMGHDCIQLSEGKNYTLSLEDETAIVTQIDRDFVNNATRSWNLTDTDPWNDGWFVARMVVTPSKMQQNTNYSQVQTIAWGKISEKSRELDKLSLWRCNYTWTEVATDVRLIRSGNDLKIDPSKPPVVNESSVQPWREGIGVPYIWDGGSHPGDRGGFPALQNLDDRTASLDDPLHLFVEPYGTIELDDLGSPEKDEYILEEINHGFRFVWAQLANIELRHQQDEEEPGELSAIRTQQSFDAIIVKSQQYRLFQNPVATYVIIGILSLVFVVNMWALISQFLRKRLPSNYHQWLLDFDLGGLAPDNFNSIAMSDSLLRNSNYWQHFPSNARWIPTTELHEKIKTTFQMGWFLNETTHEQVYTIGALDDEEFPLVHTDRNADCLAETQKEVEDRHL